MCATCLELCVKIHVSRFGPSSWVVGPWVALEVSCAQSAPSKFLVVLLYNTVKVLVPESYKMVKEKVCRSSRVT